MVATWLCLKVGSPSVLPTTGETSLRPMKSNHSVKKKVPYLDLNHCILIDPTPPNTQALQPLKSEPHSTISNDQPISLPLYQIGNVCHKQKCLLVDIAGKSLLLGQENKQSISNLYNSLPCAIWHPSVKLTPYTCAPSFLQKHKTANNAGSASPWQMLPIRFDERNSVPAAGDWPTKIFLMHARHGT